MESITLKTSIKGNGPTETNQLEIARLISGSLKTSQRRSTKIRG